MGEILESSIKLYHPLTKTEGATHGGDINTSDPITDATSENLFDNVSNAERVSGTTDYRKFFIRNENVDDWVGVLAWISQASLASNITYSMALGTNAGTQTSEAEGLTYYTPDSKEHADVLSVGTLAQNGYKAVWVKQVVAAAGNGYTNNSFKVAFESS